MNSVSVHQTHREPAGAEILGIDAPTLPYDHHYDLYQAYYHCAIRDAVRNTKVESNHHSLSRLPRILRFLRKTRGSYKLQRLLGSFEAIAGRPMDRIASAIGGQAEFPAGHFHRFVGQYVFRMADGTVKNVCIDAQDGGEITSEKLLHWSDLYFKTNFWASREYDPRVVPLYNGNPLLLGHLDRLRSLRKTEPSYDLCFIVRVWGGTDEVSGIEHNLRLLEAAAKCDCGKFIGAYLVAGDFSKIAKRLDRQGIPWRLTPFKLADLWKISASSRLNMIRLGLHSCVPWRMADLLAMGACPVLDQSPISRWPVPRAEGDNFLNLGAVPDGDTCVAPDCKYALIPGLVEKFLSDENKLTRIRENNARYFDRNLAPDVVGKFICAQVAKPRIVAASKMARGTAAGPNEL